MQLHLFADFINCSLCKYRTDFVLHRVISRSGMRPFSHVEFDTVNLEHEPAYQVAGSRFDLTAYGEH